MKKKVLIVFLVFILLAQLLSACSQSTLKEGEKKTEEAKNEEVTVAEIKEDTEKATEAEVKKGSEVGEEKSEWLTMVPNHDYKSSEFAVGPNGEDAVPADEIELTDEQYEAIKEKKLKAVLLWAGAGEWYNAMTDGAKEEFKKLGIEVAAISDANFDPATQATQIETALALNPDIILTLPVDPVAGTAAFKPAVEKGVKIVFADNGVNDYRPGEDYVSIVTGDQYGMGRS